MIADGSCTRCGCVPRNASGLCATCVDEDAVRAGEVEDDAAQALWRQALDQERVPAISNKAHAWNEAIEAAEEAANGIDPEILKGKSEAYVSIYCRARVDAATAIRALIAPAGEG